MRPWEANWNLLLWARPWGKYKKKKCKASFWSLGAESLVGEKRHTHRLWDTMRKFIAATRASLLFHLQNMEPSFLTPKGPGNPYTASLTVQRVYCWQKHTWPGWGEPELGLSLMDPASGSLSHCSELSSWSICSHFQYHKCPPMLGHDGSGFLVSEFWPLYLLCSPDSFLPRVWKCLLRFL